MHEPEQIAKIKALAACTSQNFDPPWINYENLFEINIEDTILIEKIYNLEFEMPFSDIDLSRLNFRRALCQQKCNRIIACSLNDSEGRLYLEADFPLLCGYLGEGALQELIGAFDKRSLGMRKQALIVKGLSQILLWHPQLSETIDATLTLWLSNFTMQNRLINGWLAAAAKIIRNPSNDLSNFIVDSMSLNLYFENQEISLQDTKLNDLYSET